MCAEAGRPELNRRVIVNLESGRRTGVTIEEVLVLAYVLQVPPVLLMTTVGTEDRLRVTPDKALAPIEALTWITGEQLIGEQARELAAPVSLARQYYRQMLDTMEAKRKAGADSERYQRELRALRLTTDTMREIGMPLEELPDDLTPIYEEES